MLFFLIKEFAFAFILQKITICGVKIISLLNILFSHHCYTHLHNYWKTMHCHSFNNWWQVQFYLIEIAKDFMSEIENVTNIYPRNIHTKYWHISSFIVERFRHLVEFLENLLKSSVRNIISRFLLRFLMDIWDYFWKLPGVLKRLARFFYPSWTKSTTRGFNWSFHYISRTW